MPDADITNLRLPRTWVTAQLNDPAFDISTDELDDNLRILGDADFGGNKLQNVTDPTLAQDVATKNYVDTANVQNFFDTAGTGLTSTGSTVNAIGTANRITVNANDIDIASTYVGQLSIITLGTITTGIWNGTSIANAFIDNLPILGTLPASPRQINIVNAEISATAGIVNSKLVDIATARILGRVTAATGVREELTGTQATTLLDTFTDTLKGLAPLSGGGTTNFLRADGTWAAPPGGGSQTPWVSTIDAADFSLQNLDILNFNTVTDTPVAAAAEIWWNTASGMFLNVPTGDNFDFTVNAVSQMTINVSTIDFQNNNLTDIDDITPTSLNSVAIANYATNSNVITFTNKTYDADAAGNVLTNVGSSEIKSEMITGQATVTALSGDFILISDTSDTGNLKKVDALDFLGGASQTPWASTIDAADFSLTNLDILNFNTVTDTPVITAAEIWWNTASGMFLNVPTGDNFDFTVNGVSQMTVNVSTIDFQANTLTDILDITSITSLNGVAIGNYLLTTDQPFLINGLEVSRTVTGGALVLGTNALEFNATDESISIQTGDMIFDVPTTDFFSFDIAGVPEVTISTSQMDLTGMNLVNAVTTSTVTGVSGITGLGTQAQALDMGNNNITIGTGVLNFSTAGTSISEQTSDMIFDVSTGDFFSFDIAGVPEYTFSASTFNINGNTITNTGILTLPTATDTLVARDTTDILTNKTMDGDLNTFVDINETQMNVSVGAATTVLTSNGVGSAPSYAAPAGGEFTAAWTADHNQGGSVFGLRDALFVDPTVTTKKIQMDLVGMTAAVTATLDFNFTTAKTLTFPDATDTLVGKDTTDIFTGKSIDADGTGNVLTNIGSSEIKSEIITGQATVTAISGDFILISDTTDAGNLKKVDALDFLGGASQTPWLSDIDANTFALTWLGVDVAAPAGTVEYITNLAAGLVSNVATSGIHDWQVNNVSQMTLSVSQLDLQANQLVLGSTANVILFGAGESIGMEANDMVFDVTVSDFFRFSTVGTERVNIGAAGLDLLGNDLIGVGSLPAAGGGAIRLGNNESILWRNQGDTTNFGIQGDLNDNIFLTAGTDLDMNANVIILDADGDLTLDGATDDRFKITIPTTPAGVGFELSNANGKLVMEQQTSSVSNWSTDISASNLGTSTGNRLKILSEITPAADSAAVAVMQFAVRLDTVATIGTRPLFIWLNNTTNQGQIEADGTWNFQNHNLDFIKQTEYADELDPPAPAAGFGTVFLDSADDILKIIHNDTTVVSLEGTGAQTPWTQDIDANTFALTWTSVDAAAPAGTVEYFTNLTAGLVSNVATGLIHDWQVNNVSQLTLSVSALDLQANDITNVVNIIGGTDNTMEFDERASDPAVAADKVVLYAKDVAGDTHLFQDNSTETPIDLTTGSETFNWTADHSTNGNSFLLTDDATPPAGTVMAIYSETADLNYNVSATNLHQWRINDLIEMSLSDVALNLATLRIDMSDAQIIRWAANNNRRISNSGTGFIFEIEASDTFNFEVQNILEYSFSSTTFNINGNTITNTGILTLPTDTDTLVGKQTTDIFTNKTYDADATGNVLTNVGSSEIKSEIITGLATVTAIAGDFVMFSDTTDSGNLKKADVNDFLGGGGEFTAAWTADHNQGGSGFSLRDARFSDATDSTKEVTMDISGNTTAIVLTLATTQSTAQTLTIPNLTGAATMFVTPALETLVMGTNDITGIDALTFVNEATLPAASVTYITKDASGFFRFNVPSASAFKFTVNGTDEIDMNSGGIVMNNNTITMGTGRLEFENNDTDIKEVSDNLEYDVPSTFSHIFRVANVAEWLLGASSIKSGDVVTPVLDFERTTAQADDYVIGDIRFRHPDGGAVLENYAKITGTMEFDFAGNEEGSLKFFVTENGNHDVLKLVINDNGANNMEIFSLDVLHTIINNVPRYRFYTDRTTPVPSGIGTIEFAGDSDAASNLVFAEIQANTDVVIHASRAGSLRVNILESGSLNNFVIFGGVGGECQFFRDVVLNGSTVQLRTDGNDSGDSFFGESGTNEISLTAGGQAYVWTTTQFVTNNKDVVLGSGDLFFTTAGTGISEQTNDIIFDVSTGNSFSFDIAGVPEVTIDATNMDLTGLSIINATMDGDLNTFVDINETQMDVSVGAATTVLTSNGVGSAPTYQTPSGGEFTGAWTADHNQGGSAFGLRDALFVDPTVTTKKIQMDLVGMTAAITAILDFNFTTAKTLTFPDATDTLMGKATVDIMTNKSFDANGAGNVLTNVENADIAAAAAIVETKFSVAVGVANTVLTSNGVGSAPTYQTAAGGEFTAAWTANHNQAGSGFALLDLQIGDTTDPTKRIDFTLDGMTTAITLTIDTNQTTNQTLEIPNTAALDQFVLEDFTQTLTNKTLTTPTIGSFVNSTHAHTAGAGGGQLTNTALITGDFNAITGIGTQAQDLVMNGNNVNLTSTGTVFFSAADTAISEQGGNMIFDVPTALNFRMDIAGATAFVFTAAALQVGFGGGGTNILMSANAGNGYLEQGALTTPLTPADGFGRFYNKEVATVTTPFFIGDDGVEQNLTASGSQTPWASTIDAADFSLQNLDILEFNTVTDTPVITEGQIYYNDTTTGMNFNTKTLDDFTWRINGAIEMTYSIAGGLDLQPAGSNGLIQLADQAEIRWAGDATRRIQSTSGGMNIAVNAGSFFDFEIGGVSALFIDVDELDMNSNNIDRLQNIRFITSTALPAVGDRGIHYDDAEGMIFNAVTGDFHQFEIQGVAQMTLNATSLSLTTNNLALANNAQIQWAGSSVRFIQNNTGGMTYNVDATPDTHDFQINSASYFFVRDGEITASTGAFLQFDPDQHTITPAATSLTIDASVSTDDLIFSTGGVTRCTITDTTVNAASGVTVQENGTDISPIGIHDSWYSAKGFIDKATLGTQSPGGLKTRETTTNDVNINYFDFTNNGTAQGIQGEIVLPRNFDVATSWTATIYWTPATGATTGDVAWKIQLVAISNDDPLDSAFAAEVEQTDTFIAVDDLHITPAFTFTMPADVASDLYYIQIVRDSSDAQDTLDGDAQFLGLQLRITTNAATAA